MSAEIVVTGIGLVTPAGEDRHALARLVSQGEPARFPPVSVPGFPEDADCTVGAVTGADPEPFLRDRKNLKYMDTLARLLVRAAGLAVSDAALVPAELDPFRVGVYMGIGFVACEPGDLKPLIAAGRTPDGRFDAALLGNRCRINPISVFRSLPNIPACQISIGLGFRGENSVLYPGAAQSAMAVAEAVDALGEGRCDVALAGGAAQASSFLTLHTLRMIGCLPGTGQPAGTPPADGAGVLVLERRVDALARGARLFGQILAVTGSGDGGRPYEGPASPGALQRALASVLGDHSGEGGFAVLGDDGHARRAAMAREAFARVLGPAGSRWRHLDTRASLGNMAAGNFAVDLATGLTLAAGGGPGLCLVGALGPGSDAAACLLRCVPS